MLKAYDVCQTGYGPQAVEKCAGRRCRRGLVGTARRGCRAEDRAGEQAAHYYTKFTHRNRR
jgi:hypothetical protein